MQIKATLNTITTLTDKINEDAVKLHYYAKDKNIKATKARLEALLLIAKKLENELTLYTIVNQNKKLNDLLDELQKNNLITLKLSKAIKTLTEPCDPVHKLNEINISNAKSVGTKTKGEFEKLLNLLAISQHLSICKK